MVCGECRPKTALKFFGGKSLWVAGFRKMKAAERSNRLVEQRKRVAEKWCGYLPKVNFPCFEKCFARVFKNTKGGCTLVAGKGGFCLLHRFQEA